MTIACYGVVSRLGVDITIAGVDPLLCSVMAQRPMTIAWQIASINFCEDDGSLPTVEFDQLLPESIGKLYRFVSKSGYCVTESPTVWDDQAQQDVPLLSVCDPCKWVHDGRTDSFHCCFGGISIDGTVIPTLGIFVFKDAVEIDFRMGKDWNPENVEAFFKLLARLKSLAPESRIRSAQSEGLMDEASFLKALHLYLDENGRTQR